MAKRVMHKYGAKQTVRDSIRFASKAEASYYEKLKLAQKSGELLFFLRQVPFDLPGKTTYRCDFMEFWAPLDGESAGEVRVVDVKGVETEVFRLKKRQLEEIYPIKLTIIKKGS